MASNDTGNTTLFGQRAMVNSPSNIHPEYVSQVLGDALASEFAKAVDGMFTITGYARRDIRKGSYVTLFCKPTKSISDSLLINREVLVVITKYEDLDPRIVHAIKDIITDRSPQLTTELAIVIHSDPSGNSKLRQWGNEQNIKVVPIYRPKRSALPAPTTLRQQLTAGLLSVDPFQVTGPVSDDTDFFGRRNDALDFVRQLENGRIKAIFGIRKIGKTSFINRIISIARERGSPRIAMVDCSLKDFYTLNAEDALRVLAKVSKLAANQGYAHVSEALRRTKDELLPVFSDLWLRDTIPPLAIIFDEVDYITPGSPTASHWRHDFNEFWREFRVLVQEAHRHEVFISVLVSGVSSKYFREASIGGAENSALYFIPDEYLPPFARRASEAMISELGRRCGLTFTLEAKNKIAETCADMPFWIRMAGSYIHRSIEVDARPQTVSSELTSQLLEGFIRSDGAELARVALQHLRSVYPEVISLLQECVSEGSLPADRGRLLVRYGLASQIGMKVIVVSELVKTGIRELQALPVDLMDAVPSETQGTEIRSGIGLSTTEWTEELAVINKRRNQIEKDLRQLIRFTLKAELPSGRSWVEAVLQSLPATRREALSWLPASVLMDKLYWLELGHIITKNWSHFERVFGDQERFKWAMHLINDRPDAHAKDVDLADLALYRRELTWLEERVNS